MKLAPNILDILLERKFVKSKSEARRLIKQGAIRFKVNKDCGFRKTVWKIIDDVDWQPVFSGILKIGKRRFLRIITPWMKEEIR